MECLDKWFCLSVSRFPWDHPHLEPVDGEDYSLPEGCVQYFIAGQSPAASLVGLLTCASLGLPPGGKW